MSTGNFRYFHILHRLNVDSLGFHDTIHWKIAKTSKFEMYGNETRWNDERSRGSFQSSLVSCIIFQWKKNVESLENLILVAIKICHRTKSLADQNSCQTKPNF